MKVVLDYVLFPVSLVLSSMLGVLVCYAYRGVTPRLPVPEPLFIVGACSEILVTVVVAIILDIRGE